MTAFVVIGLCVGLTINALSVIILSRTVGRIDRDVEELRHPWPGDRP